MADEPTVFGPKATEQIAKTVREVSRRMMLPRGDRGRWQATHSEPLHKPAVIGSSLAAPASSLAVATSCTVYFLELQSDGTQELNENEYTAYNDDPELACEPGTYCRLEWLNGRWMIYYLGCGPQSELVAVLP